jgi:hypothetical protein
MKAVEYAKQYQATPTLDTLASILTDFVRDLGRIGEARHIVKGASMAALLKEQERKLQKFCDLTGVRLKPDTLRIIIRDQHPELLEKMGLT